MKFGLFGGENVSIDKAEPIDTAVTNKEGIAVFKTGTSYSFYKDKYGDGPYCVKEIAIPAVYKNVWKPSLNKEWTYKIPTLKSEALFDLSSNIPLEAQLENTNYQAEKNLIRAKIREHIYLERNLPCYSGHNLKINMKNSLL